MLVALSDTHGTDDPRLTDYLHEVVRDAELVLHAGDFTTTAVLEAFETEAMEFVAVHGNSDSAGVRARLPETQSVEWGGRRFVLAHGHRHSSPSLSLLARQERATVAVVGHTHRAGIHQWGGGQQEGGMQEMGGGQRKGGMQQGSELTVVNPGSHADPRGGRPTYAAFEQTEGGVMAQLCAEGGQVFETVEL